MPEARMIDRPREDEGPDVKLPKRMMGGIRRKTERATIKIN